MGNYDLTQTGAQVQSILNKCNALPSNPDKVIANKIDKAISTTYAALKALRDGGTLAPGQMYRITDFVTTTAQAETQSAGHAFDLLVLAATQSQLTEQAWAVHHSGDTYFQNAKLEAWQLKYSLDNDTTRFAWADATNGKGVIYWMRDEYGNECPYDFKNIMFARYQITACAAVPALVNEYLGYADIQSTGTKYPSGATISNTAVYRYTFDYLSGTTSNDLTVYQASQSKAVCYENHIGAWFIDEQKKQQLNNISFGGSQFQNCYGNRFMAANRNMSFGYGNYRCSFGNNNYRCSFGNSNSIMSFGNSNWYNSFGNDNYRCSFGNNNYSCSFGNNNYSCSFGNNNYSCSFGNGNGSMSFGNSNWYNSFGNSNSSMSFGNSNSSMSFGNDNGSMSFGNNNGSMSFGNSNSSMSFGNSNWYNSFGNGISGVAIGNSTIGLTFTLGLNDFSYNYGSWDEDEDPETGDTIISGIDGTQLSLEFSEASAVSGHVKIQAKHGTETTTLYDADITTESDGTWSVDGLSASWDAVPGDTCYIFYEASWQENGYRAARTDYDSY